MYAYYVDENGKLQFGRNFWSRLIIATKYIIDKIIPQIQDYRYPNSGLTLIVKNYEKFDGTFSQRSSLVRLQGTNPLNYVRLLVFNEEEFEISGQQLAMVYVEKKESVLVNGQYGELFGSEVNDTIKVQLSPNEEFAWIDVVFKPYDHSHENESVNSMSAIAIRGKTSIEVMNMREKYAILLVLNENNYNYNITSSVKLKYVYANCHNGSFAALLPMSLVKVSIEAKDNTDNFSGYIRPKGGKAFCNNTDGIIPKTLCEGVEHLKSNSLYEGENGLVVVKGICKVFFEGKENEQKNVTGYLLSSKFAIRTGKNSADAALVRMNATNKRNIVVLGDLYNAEIFNNETNQVYDTAVFLISTTQNMDTETTVKGKDLFVNGVKNINGSITLNDKIIKITSDVFGYNASVSSNVTDGIKAFNGYYKGKIENAEENIFEFEDFTYSDDKSPSSGSDGNNKLNTIAIVLALIGCANLLALILFLVLYYLKMHPSRKLETKLKPKSKVKNDMVLKSFLTKESTDDV